MKKLILTTLLTLLIFAPLSARAEKSIYVHFGGFSQHFKDRGPGLEHRRSHNNLGLEYETSLYDLINIQDENWHWSLTAQHLKNSLNHSSTLIATGPRYKWTLSEDWNVGVAFLAGVQNGYPRRSKGRDRGDFLPVAYPVVELNYKRIGIYGTCVPHIYDSGFCLVGFKARVFDF